MTTVGSWKHWFAWRWVRIDGKRRWLPYVERRRVTVSLELSAFAEPDTTSFWQDRNYCPVDHQFEEMVQELLDWVVLLTGLGCINGVVQGLGAWAFALRRQRSHVRIVSARQFLFILQPDARAQTETAALSHLRE
jgi:hypothetical protein